MDFLTKNKTLSGIIILGIFILLAFFLYSSTNKSSSSAVAEVNTDTDATTQAFLVTLASLNTIHLDGSIFTEPVFVSLTDFGIVIPAQPAGRRNPFLPIKGISFNGQ